MSDRALILFCVLLFALSWSLQYVALAVAGNPESPAAAPWLVGVMFTPALVTLASCWFNRSARAALLWRPTWRMLPLLVLAVLVPTLIAFGTVAIVEFAGWGKSGWFVFSQQGVAISGGPWKLGKGFETWPLFAANVAVTGAYFAAFNSIFAAGEEICWRGLLQGQLTQRFGVSGGIVLLGLIWSLWHLPALLAGYNFPEHPVLGAFVLFPLELIGASLFAGWLTIRSGSFWPAALSHGAVNSIEEGVTSNLHLTMPHLYEDVVRLALTVAFGLLFWLLLRKRDAKPARTESFAAA